MTTTYSLPTTIEKSATSQLRVVATEYKGRPQLDVREYRTWDGSPEFRPTKHGVTISQEMLEPFLAAIAKHAKELPQRVTDVKEVQISWAVAKNVEDVRFKKGRIYLTEADALASTPPDTYVLFKIRAKEGVVINERELFVRDAGEWVPVPVSAPKAKTVRSAPAPAPKKKVQAVVAKAKLVKRR